MFFSNTLRCRAYLAVALSIIAGLLPVSAAERNCISNATQLKQVLALPGPQKSGQVYCLEPGLYEGLQGRDFLGAFTGIDPERPVVFEAADPDNPPVFRFWLFGGDVEDRKTRRPNGNAILRDLVFDLSNTPEVPLGQNGFKGSRSAISLGNGTQTQNVTLERISVRGPMRQGREGGREAEKFLFGVLGLWTDGITIRDSRFERIVHGIGLGGTNLLIEGNRMRHSWGDLIEITPQVLPKHACLDTENVIIRNNILQEVWSNNRIHPDVVHMFAASKVRCNVRNVLIEGTVAFPGDVGLLQPGYPAGLRNSAPVPVPPRLPEGSGQLHRLIGPGTTTLPKADCDEATQLIGVQRDPSSQGPVTLTPAPGDRLALNRQSLTRMDLDAPWETWRLSCRKGNSGTWQALRSMPSMQGIFTNGLPGPKGYSDITIRHNILWITAPMAIGFRDPDNRSIHVERNSFLLPWPGDLNGDGQVNTFEDGFNTRFRASWILLADGEDLRVNGTVASAPLKVPGQNNDAQIVHNDGAAAMGKRFKMQSGTVSPVTGKPVRGPRLSPNTPVEAVEFARPRNPSPLSGRPIGAVGVTAAEDPYDWSWVKTPW